MDTVVGTVTQSVTVVTMTVRETDSERDYDSYSVSIMTVT